MLEIIAIGFGVVFLGSVVIKQVAEEHCWAQEEEFMVCKSRSADEEKCLDEITWFCR